MVDGNYIKGMKDCLTKVMAMESMFCNDIPVLSQKELQKISRERITAYKQLIQTLNNKLNEKEN